MDVWLVWDEEFADLEIVEEGEGDSRRQKESGQCLSLLLRLQ